MPSPWAFRVERGSGVSAPPRPRGTLELPLVPDSWPPTPVEPGGGGGSNGNGGNSGGGGGGGGGRRDPFEGHPRPGARELAFQLVLVCIGVLFLVFLGLALAVWKSSPTWPPPGAPRPPQGLLASTLLLLACSVALAHSLGAHRRGDPSGVKVGTFAALGLGLLFLICQGLLWREFLGLGIPASNGYVALFFALTGLHALHIAGGIVFLVRVLTELYMAGDGLGSATALRLCGAYWHAMGAIWVVLFAVLYVLR